MKLFDFGGMDKRHLPFREIEPEEGNVVVSISYSGTGHAFLVCTAGSQPKVGECLAVVNFRRAGFMFSRASGVCSRVLLQGEMLFAQQDVRVAAETALRFLPFGYSSCEEYPGFHPLLLWRTALLVSCRCTIEMATNWPILSRETRTSRYARGA